MKMKYLYIYTIKCTVEIEHRKRERACQILNFGRSLEHNHECNGQSRMTVLRNTYHVSKENGGGGGGGRGDEGNAENDGNQQKKT